MFRIIMFIFYWGVPIASLVTVALSAIALASPNSDTLKHVALLTIASPTPDGPRVWLGLFSSCAQGNSQLNPICTGLKMHPEYDFSVLPETAPTYVFTGPSLKFSKRLAWVSITIIGPIFTLLALWIPLRGSIVQLKILQRYLLEYPVLAWIGGAIGVIGNSFKLGYIGHVMFCWPMLIILIKRHDRIARVSQKSLPPEDAEKKKQNNIQI